jgi:hypothetical protein
MLLICFLTAAKQPVIFDGIIQAIRSILGI